MRRVAFAGVGLCAYAVCAFIGFALFSADEGTTLWRALTVDAFNVVIVVSDLTLLVVGIGITGATIIGRRDLAHGKSVLRAAQALLVIYGVAVVTWMIATTISQRADMTARIFTAVIAVMMLLLWTMALHWLRRLCERLMEAR